MPNKFLSHEYNGAIVPQRISDNYVDLTALCKSEGKELSNYLQLKSKKAFLDELSSDLGIARSELVQINKGQGGHTFGHPYVAMNVAIWVSTPCEVWAMKTLVHGVVEASRERLEKQFQPKATLKEIDAAARMLGKRFGKSYEQGYIIHQLNRHQPHLLGPEPKPEERASTKSQKALRTPTYLASKVGLFYKTGNPSGEAANNLLGELGYQEKIDGKWQPTKKGEPHSDTKSVNTGSKTEKNQLFWFDSIIPVLQEHAPGAV